MRVNGVLFRKAHEAMLAQSLDLEKLQPFGGGDARRCCLLWSAGHLGVTATPCSSKEFPAVGWRHG